MPRRKPKHTTAFSVFVRNLDRSRAFLRIFDHERGAGQPSNDEKELLRGSLVFAVGALDAFLSDLILEIVPVHGPTSPDMTEALKAIAKTDPSLSLRVALASSPAESRGEFRSALAEWLAGRSFHGPEKVVQALGYVNCQVPWESFDIATGRNTAMELGKITKDRHGIVHEGNKPYIKRELAGNAVELVGAIAALIDAEVCKLY